MGQTTTLKKISHLNRFKLHLCFAFAFLLGCMFSFSIMPIDRTCRIEDSDREFNIMKNSKLKNPELIILILSAPNNIERRKVIRKTWLSLIPPDQENIRDSKKFKVKHFFAIGHLALNKDQLKEIEKEQYEYNDILFIPIQDSYANLTLKVLKSFEWLNEQYDYGLGFKYVLKCDDDSFVRLDNFIHELKHIELLYLKTKLSSVQKMSAQNNSPYLRINLQINSNETKNNLSLYWGYFDGRATMMRKGKWKDQNWIACDKYILYALGGGYILSKRLITYIAKNADYLRLFNAEDVSVGFWLSPIDNILRIHDIRFDTEWTSRGCQNFFLISHNIQPEKMQEMISNIKSHKVLCSSPHLKRNFYHYNWSVPPSQCCKTK
ncbi:beta-1,3-galactosyltransferase 6 [Coccinella septempunctata]|uniref:beta-1,3-galactosyltransferase 6 n=1 Tax=Coccinella septempunctata TaxID=41139 RepID=UPI001D06E407|nr:beta-1,3-galactosyltransferase 6 [Coccinella septempunctata]